jgi:DNA-binding HxlR family transcriptional regulator
MDETLNACASAAVHGDLAEMARLRPVILVLRRRWSPAILAVLSTAPTHYLALYRRLPGISQKVLTEHLRVLEREGMLSRTGGAGGRVCYGLTRRGESLWKMITLLRDWLAEDDRWREQA